LSDAKESRQVARHRKRQAKKSYRLFETFAQRVWKHLGLPPLTDVQVDMARYLQFGPSKRMLEAFRGVGKSWLTAAFVVWCLYHDPQRKILIVSASKDYADTISVFIKRLIDELPECAFLRPRVGQRNSLVQFDVGPALADKSPSVKSVGIFGQITGSRAHIIIVDDIEVPKNSLTPLMRERLAEASKELNDILVSDLDEHGNLLPDEERPSIIYLGTPQSEMSLYNRLPERGYHIRVWPARVPRDVKKYSGRLAPFVLKMIEDGAKPGTPIDPKRFDHRALIAKELEAGKSRFALQYQLDTSLSDMLKYPLRAEDLMVMSVDAERAPVTMAYAKDPNETLLRDLQPVGFSGDYYYRPVFIDKEWAPFTGTVMAIDPSGKGEDETGYAVVKMLLGRLFLVASGGLSGGYSPENLQALADIAKKHAVNTVVIEKNFGDGMFGALLKPVLAKTHPCTIEEAVAVGQKELRIIGTLEPVLNQHRLVVDVKVIEADLEVSDPLYSLMYQLTRITKERGCLAHDDRLDALEMAVKYWQAQLEADTDKVAKAFKEEQEREFLEKWLERTSAPLMGHNGGPALGDEDWDARSGNVNWRGD
jgi:hypothetical protein